MLSDPLSQLHGIHFPKPIAWWPLAPGWYVMTALLVIVILAVTYLLYRQYQQCLRRRVVLKTIDHLAWQYQHQQITAVQALAQLSVLVKRIAISFDQQNMPQALSGKAWLHYLDQGLGQPEFSRGVGRCLLDGPYQKQVDFDAAVFELVIAWAKNKMAGKRCSRRNQALMSDCSEVS